MGKGFGQQVVKGIPSRRTVIFTQAHTCLREYIPLSLPAGSVPGCELIPPSLWLQLVEFIFHEVFLPQLVSKTTKIPFFIFLL